MTQAAALSSPDQTLPFRGRIDGRRLTTKRWRVVVADLIEQLGGEVNSVQLITIQRIATFTVEAEKIEAQQLNGEEINRLEYRQIVEQQQALLSRLGFWPMAPRPRYSRRYGLVEDEDFAEEDEFLPDEADPEQTPAQVPTADCTDVNTTDAAVGPANATTDAAPPSCGDANSSSEPVAAQQVEAAAVVEAAAGGEITEETPTPQNSSSCENGGYPSQAAAPENKMRFNSREAPALSEPPSEPSAEAEAAARAAAEARAAAAAEAREQERRAAEAAEKLQQELQQIQERYRFLREKIQRGNRSAHVLEECDKLKRRWRLLTQEAEKQERVK